MFKPPEAIDLDSRVKPENDRREKADGLAFNREVQ